ncbi:MAG: hypothetical protein ACYCZY_13565 [Lacisediminihabitans sp.]
MDAPSPALWDNADIQKFLRLGKSATNEVMAEPDFPAPAYGDRRYRRYFPEDIVQWARDRAARKNAERRTLGTRAN